MKSPLSFPYRKLVEYHEDRLRFMKNEFKRKVLCGQMKDTTATQLIEMQKYTLQLIKEKDPARQMTLGENIQTNP
jgi:hypothetical protein